LLLDTFLYWIEDEKLPTAPCNLTCLTCPSFQLSQFYKEDIIHTSHAPILWLTFSRPGELARTCKWAKMDLFGIKNYNVF
jgi:hypothetical protein